MTLADAAASRTALAWFEAVAVVQGLCEAVEARGPAGGPRVPELKHIGLTAEGRVTLLAEGPSGHSPVHRAGLVLLAITPEEQLPVQLRLLILEAVSPRPKLKSLGELSRELEFFERPDRLSIVRGVHERFQRQSGAPAMVPAEPPTLLEPLPPKRRHRRWSRRRVLAGALIALTMAAAAALAWAWPRPAGQRLRSATAQMTGTATGLARRGVDVARRELGDLGGRLGLKPKAQRPAELPSAAPNPRVAAPAGPSPETLADRLPAVVQMPLGALLPTEAVPKPGLPAAPVPADSAGDAREAQGATSVVYSVADKDVIPPRLVRPVVPGQSAAAGAAESLEVEIVVSPSGDVESVKSLSQAGTPAAAMMLSAIKNWSFQPASRDGAPVAYRHRMKLPLR